MKKKQFNCYKNSKKEGQTKSFVHGRMDEVICHDMRKYVWRKYNEKK
tara:strand:- start:58 stop:198 length:141 start_codon:yes stop_codon:yes gene_type:complete